MGTERFTLRKFPSEARHFFFIPTPGRVWGFVGLIKRSAGRYLKKKPSAKIAFLKTCLPAGRRSPEKFAWFAPRERGKNFEGGEAEIRAGGFRRFLLSFLGPHFFPSL